MSKSKLRASVRESLEVTNVERVKFAGSHPGFNEENPLDMYEARVLVFVEVVYDVGGPVGVDHVVRESSSGMVGMWIALESRWFLVIVKISNPFTTYTV